MRYVIETNRPIPTRGEVQSVIAQLTEPGHSVLMRDAVNRAAVYVAAKRLGFKVTTREEDGGLRVWRKT